MSRLWPVDSQFWYHLPDSHVLKIQIRLCWQKWKNCQDIRTFFQTENAFIMLLNRNLVKHVANLLCRDQDVITLKTCTRALSLGILNRNASPASRPGAFNSIILSHAAWNKQYSSVSSSRLRLTFQIWWWNIYQPISCFAVLSIFSWELRIAESEKTRNTHENIILNKKTCARTRRR